MFKPKNSNRTFELGGESEIIPLPFEKGTLTILSDKCAVLGVPRMSKYALSDYAQFQADILLWLEFGGVIALPFPVDVIDLRKQELTGKDG